MKKHYAKLLSSVLSLLMILSVFPVSVFADGTEDYQKIYDIEDLYMIRNDLDGNYILMDDIDLTDDLKDGGDWNEGMGWTPIGITATGCEPFTGVFDGNGHTLIGLRFNLTSVNSGYTGTYYCGLFGINNGTVSNLVFDSVDVSINFTKDLDFGIICGENNGNISYCKVDGQYSFKIKDGHFSIGIIAGYNSGNIGSCSISGKTVLTYSGGTGNNYYGGITGYNSKDAVICNCSSLINESHTINGSGIGGQSNHSYWYIGGIVGYSEGEVRNSFWSKIINSSAKGCYDYYYSGGSYYSGGGTSHYYHNAIHITFGGIVGYNSGTLTDCFCSSGIALNGFQNGSSYDTKAYNYCILGGICGQSTGNINNVYFVGSVGCSGYFGSIVYGDILGDGGNCNNAHYLLSKNKGIGNGTDTCISHSATLMTKQGVYTGFDFDNVWTFYPCSKYKYPQLRSVPQDTSANNHTCKNPIASVEPTCTEDGYIRGMCDGCGEEFTQTIPKLGHDFSEEVTVDKAAACEESGSSSRHCTRCEAVTDVATISAKGHSFGEWQNTAASCEEQGVSTRECTVCHKVETKYFEAAGHISVTDKGYPATCEESGLTDGSHCSVCHKVLVEQKVIEPKGHTVVIDAGTPATCTKDGYSSGSHCSECGKIFEEKEIIPTLGHKTVTDKAVKPTCTEDGLTEGSHCERCKEVFKAQETVPATGHKTGDWQVKTYPTCTLKGEEVKICSECGEIIEKRSIEKTTHSFGRWIESVTPTCTEPGEEYRECSGCHYRESRSIDPVGHKWNTEYTVDKAATCTEPGSKSIHCKNCSITKGSVVIPALGHDYINGICSRCESRDEEYLLNKAIESAKSELTGAKQNAKSDEAKSILDKAIQATNGSTSIDEVNSIVSKAKTDAASADKALADAKVSAITELENAKTNAKSNEAKSILENGINAVNSAASISTVNTAKTNAVTAANKAEEEYAEKSDLDKINIKAAAAKTVDYRSIVTIRATATGVPEGYHLALYINGAKVKDGSGTEVSYECGELKSDVSYTVKVVDANGNVQKDSSGNNLSKDSKVTVNAGFFKKLAAFFKGLFGSLPKVEVKP